MQMVQDAMPAWHHDNLESEQPYWVTNQPSGMHQFLDQALLTHHHNDLSNNNLHVT
jgi:hypothetical protein